MLKMILPSDKGKVIGFGLSRKNCELLLAGKPIFFKGEEVGEAGKFFVIIAGETEEAILEEMNKGLNREGNADA